MSDLQRQFLWPEIAIQSGNCNADNHEESAMPECALPHATMSEAAAAFSAATSIGTHRQWALCVFARRDPSLTAHHTPSAATKHGTANAASNKRWQQGWFFGGPPHRRVCDETESVSLPIAALCQR